MTGILPDGPIVTVPLIIGVTSHRNLVASEIGPLRECVREFLRQLQQEYPGMPLLVLSALAEGGDQLVAQEALAAGARLMAPLPLPREVYVEDFVDPGVRADFDALCDRAQVVPLPLPPAQPRRAIEAVGLPRDRQYARAGVYIASHCHILLALWDGKASERLGGTAQIARYHLTGVIPGLIDRRRSRYQLPGGGDERLLYHIVCSRDQEHGEPAEGLRPLKAWWRTTDSARAAAEGMPPAFRPTFARMAEFNADCRKYAEDIAEAEAASRRSRPPRPATQTMDRLFVAADWLAIHFQRRVLSAMRAIYTLAALMGIAFMCYSDLPAQDYMIFVFLLLFASGTCLAVIARHRGWHRKYLDYRALAEGLRVQSHWRHAGISMTADQEFAHDNFLQKQNIELGWVRNVMRTAGLYPPGGRQTPPPGSLREVFAEWIGERGRAGQLHYYECKVRERTRLHRITELIGQVSLWTGIAISLFLAMFVFHLSQDLKTILVAVMAVFSILAAVREAYAFRKADKELIKQYRFMYSIFANAEAALKHAREPAEQLEILRSLGEAALAEHAEWALMHRERPLEQGKL